MKKLFVTLVCVVTCLVFLASCNLFNQDSTKDENHEHIRGSWVGDVYGHWQPEHCSLDRCVFGPSAKEYHIDTDENNICDVCAYEYEFIFKLTADEAGYELDKVGPGYKGGGVRIPAEHNGLPVTEIGYDAFESEYKLTSVVIPATVALIDGDAFENQTSLTNVSVGEGVVTIGVSAFARCTNLKTVIISDATEYIYASAFEGCSALETITLGNSIKEIAGSVFEECTSLKTVTIPASIEKMGSWVFYETNITNIYFGVSAPGENWSENWSEGLGRGVNIHWSDANGGENGSDIIEGKIKLSDILQRLPYGYNVEGLMEKYNFNVEQYCLIDNSDDYCELLSDVGVPYEGPFDFLFEENVIFCYIRCVTGSADFISVEYFYDRDTNNIECKTVYQPGSDVSFPDIEICWCVDLVEVPRDIFEQYNRL